jgi:serine/threonine protein kinase/AraC-like DNA-binding protein
MDLTGITINERLVLTNKMHEGGISSLYRAYYADRKDEPVVVKIFKDNITSQRPENVIRFRQELTSVSNLEHKNIAKIYDTGEVFKLHYCAMEYTPGMNLSELQKKAGLSTSQIVDIVAQTCRGLECLHRNGIKHRFLEPGNIIAYTGNGSAGMTIKIIGVGIAHIIDFNELKTPDTVAEMLAYLSPEQSGLHKRSVDERSDLYSLGVIFYQLLTGKIPFADDDLFPLIRQYFKKNPSPPSSINKSIPAILDRIVFKLLEIEPESRYQSAKGLLWDLERFTRGDTDYIPGLNDSSIQLSYRTKLIGRKKETARLMAAIDDMRDGRGGVCLISGEAGIGKTRLIEELHHYADMKEITLIQGRCHYGVKSEPHTLLVELFNDYLKIFSQHSDLKKKEVRARMQSALGSLGEAILKINPLIEEILGKCPALVQLDPNAENQRFLSVLSQFFLCLGEVERGLVFIIEDLQWSSDWMFDLLGRISDNISNSSLLIIGTYRNDEISDEHGTMKFIKKVKSRGDVLVELSIEKFDYFNVAHFVSGMLYETEMNVKEISDFINQKGKGNPLFTIEILKHLVNEKAVYYENNRWNIDNKILHDTVVPETIIDILVKRISFLNRREALILSYAAVIGRTFGLDLLFRLLDEYDGKDIVAAIDECIKLQLIAPEASLKGEFSFVHNRIQEAFYGSVDVETRKRMHAKIAAALEDMYLDNKADVLFRLTNHFIESGNAEKSFEYAYPASFKAAERFANIEAIRYFGIVITMLEEKIKNGDESLRELWMLSKEGSARTCLRIGRYDEAIEIYNQLLPFKDDEIDRAVLLAKISTAYYKKGNLARCEEYAKIGIELLGGSLPTGRWSLMLSLIKELAIHGLHVLFPGCFVASTPKLKNTRKAVQGVFYESLIEMYMLSGRLKYVRAVVKILNHVESYMGGGPALAQVLYGYGSLLMSLARFKDALQYYHRALDIAKRINDYYDIARCCQLIGYCHEWMGEYVQSIEYYNRAIDVFDRIGDSNGIARTLNGLCNSYLLLADFKNFEITNDRFLEVTSSSNDNYHLCNALIYKTLYYLEIGSYDGAESCAMRAYNLSIENEIWMPHCIINILLASLYSQANDIEKAVAHIEKAKELYEKHKFLQYYTIYLYFVIPDIYIAEYATMKELSDKQKKLHLKKIGKSCRIALKKTKKWDIYYYQALLVTAKYCALINKNTKAKKLFLQCIDYFSRHGVKNELAKNLYEYGRFLSQIKDQNAARKSFEAAHRIFEEIGIDSYSSALHDVLGIKDEKAEPTSIQKFVYNKRLLLMDKLSAKINQISDSQELFNEVIVNAVDITSAQKGYFFLRGNNDAPVLMARTSGADSYENSYSPEIVEKVYKSGRHVNMISPRGDEAASEFRANPSGGLWSILCMPVMIKEKVIGICYLENMLSNGQFDEGDANLLSAFIGKVSSSINYAYLYNRLIRNKGFEQWAITPSIENKILLAIEYIKENFRQSISREGLADMLEINPDNLGRYFRRFTGDRIQDYINRLRVEEAAKVLRETDQKIIHIAFSIGFENISTFNKVFIKYMKTTPSKYRRLNYRRT